MDQIANERKFHVNSNSSIFQIKGNIKFLLENLTVPISHCFESPHLKSKPTVNFGFQGFENLKIGFK